MLTDSAIGFVPGIVENEAKIDSWKVRGDSLSGMKQFEIKISGRVQGVGFRAATRKQARLLRLRGWVENLSDGSVMAVICGDMESCTRFIAWCREGSAYSWVEAIDIREMKAEKLGPFKIIY